VKPVHIDFIQRESWRRVWVMALVCCVVVGTVATWHRFKVENELAALENLITAAGSDLTRIREGKPLAPDPKTLAGLKAAGQLQFDWNKVFAAAENVDVPGTRLTGFSLDMSAGVLRFDYLLEQPTKATDITEALNAGYDKRPWQLERISNSVISFGNTTVPASQPAGSAGGSWSTKVLDL
jgi:hypothetical protein